MRPAVLVVIAGLSGAGKSRFGRIVAERTGAARLDMTEMLGGEERDAAPDLEDYEALLVVATQALAGGQSVVVVGPFHTLDSRAVVLRAASESGSALLYVECIANESVRHRRSKSRALLARADDEYVRVGNEIPRACQMIIDTTVGIALWAGLASSRVEAYVGAPQENSEQVVRA